MIYQYDLPDDHSKWPTRYDLQDILPKRRAQIIYQDDLLELPTEMIDYDGLKRPIKIIRL